MEIREIKTTEQIETVRREYVACDGKVFHWKYECEEYEASFLDKRVRTELYAYELPSFPEYPAYLDLSECFAITLRNKQDYELMTLWSTSEVLFDQDFFSPLDPPTHYPASYVAEIQESRLNLTPVEEYAGLVETLYHKIKALCGKEQS